MPTWRDNPLIQNEKAWEKLKRRRGALPSSQSWRLPIPDPPSRRSRRGLGVRVLFGVGVLGVLVAVLFAAELTRLGDALAPSLGEMWEEVRALLGTGSSA